MAKKKKESKKGEEVCELFEVEEGGKEVIKKSCGVLPSKKASREELKKQEKTLRNVLIVLGIIFLALIAFLIASRIYSNPKYEGAPFSVVREGGRLFYNFKFPMQNDKEEITAYYNLYLRNDPRKIGNIIPFEGDFLLKEKTFVNLNEEFICEGRGSIAIANLVDLIELFGSKAFVIKDPDAVCSQEGEFSFINIYEGDRNKVVQIGPSCYELYVNNCEILEVTERFMLEGIVKYFKE
jgi:hypothetical protein